MNIEKRTLLAVGLLALAGCGGPEPCSISGTVVVNNKPAEGVYVIFQTAGEGAASQGLGATRTDESGAFSLFVSEPGEVAVTAFWPTITELGVETIEGPDRFGGAHRDPNRPIAKATIQEGDNNLPPISITSPARAITRFRDRR